MSFSEKFYVDESQVCLLKTATPTGVLNVPDLLNGSTRPWITVNTASPSETAQKKALIFADHLHNERDEEERKKIMARLQEAQKEGFTIYVLSDKGKLEQWDGNPIPATYSLNLQQYTKEFVNGQAWLQHTLGDSKLYLLDYFGINDLLGQPHDLLNWKTFKNNPDNLQKIMSTTSLNSFALRLQNPADIKPFIDFTNKISAHLNKIKKIEIGDRGHSEISTLSELDALLKTVPQIEEINLVGCTGSLIGLKKDQLKKLKKINFLGCSFIATDMESLLSATPQVEEIMYSGNSWSGHNASFINSTEILSSSQCKYLKKLRLHNLVVTAESIKELLNTTTQIENLEFVYCTGLTGCFSDLRRQQLMTLKTITFSKVKLTVKDVNALLQAAPELEVLKIPSCQSGAFSDLKPQQLNKLKIIHLSSPSITAMDLNTLLQAAPQLEDLAITSCTTIASGFSGLKTGQLKKLKKINFSNLSLTTADIQALLNAAPQVENIELAGLENIAGIFSKLSPKQLRNIKILSFINISVIDITTFLRNAPQACIEEISFNGCEKLAGVIASLKPIQLEKMKRITLSKTPLTVADVVTLLSTAHEVEEIVIEDCGNLAGIFQQLASLNLPKLKKIILSNTNITAKDVHKLLKSAPQLEELAIGDDDSDISGAFIELHELQDLNLVTINLSGSNIDDNDAIQLLESSPNVRAINFTSCTGISSLLLSEAQLKNIFSIDLYGTSISKEGIASLKSSAPQAKISSDFDHIKKSQSSISFHNKPSPQSSGPLGDKYFDARKTESKLSYTRYFPGIHPSEYRLFQWQPNLDSEKLEIIPVIAQDFAEIKLEEKFSLDVYRLQPGIKPVMTAEGREIILPSLNAEEKLVSLQVIDINGKPINPSELQFQYSPSTGFHKVILPKDKEGIFTINFQLAVPKTKRGLAELPKRIGRIIRPIVAKYKELPDAKETPPTFKTLRDFAHYLQKKPQGSCRHRAIAAYETLEKQYLKNISILTNDVHQLLELCVDGQFYQIDLGGRESELEELPLRATVPQPTTITQREEKAPPETKQLSIVETPLLKILEQYNSGNHKFFKETKDSGELKTELKLEMPLDEPPTPALILANSAIACQDFYLQLGQRYPSRDIFIAHCPEELSLKGSSMTTKGQIKPSYTAFSRWFSERKTGVIVVDARDFKNNELAQLNDLLDRRIEGQQLPLNVQVIIIDHPDRGYYGPDFRRRVPIKATLASTFRPLLNDAQLAVADEKIDKIEIDLFNSAYWQRILIGSWQLGKKSDEQAFSFQWSSGSLLKIFLEESQSTDKAKQIIFKNPPLHDSSFTAFITELQTLRCVGWADQITPIPPNIRFYQSSGYDWLALASQASLASLTNKAKPYVLSDANILSFIQDPSYGFSKDSSQLQPQMSYLKQCKEDKEAKGIIEIVCAYGLSESTLAQLLTAAKKQEVKVRFLLPNAQAIPDKYPLHCLTFPPVEEKTPWKNNFMTWQLHDDVYFATRELLNRYPQATCFDLSSLEAAELGRYPIFPDKLRQQFLQKGQLSMTAPLASIIEKLQAGELVILSGKVPPALYEALTSLSLGIIEGKPFKGELVIVTPPHEAPLAEALTGTRLGPTPATSENKLLLLNTIYPEIKMEQPEGPVDYASLERLALQNQLNKTHRPLSEQLLPLKPSMSTKEQAKQDEKNAKTVDKNRLHDVEQGLKISPWVMLEGATGIGKTYFLQQVLPKKQTVFTIKEWLERKSTSEPIILVIDEASFRSELGDEGENFLERFKGLQGKPPGMLWKGKYYPLTKQHKVIFAFNPASYGAGRSTAGLLSEQALKVSFEALPDFYVRARVIMPLLQNTVTNKKLDLYPIAAPLSEVYRWILQKSDGKVLITPREIKLMVNLIASWVNQYKITDSRTLSNLALEVAYDIGRQTLADYPAQVALFEANFKESLVHVRDRIIMPNTYRDCQREAYCQIQALLAARKLLSSPSNTDLGLGGLILEGGSGIGKSHFLTQIANDYKIATGQPVYFIPPNTPYREKEAILRKAFDEGALVIADEFNTSLWPNKLLNNYLMGLDEFGKPAKKPGFMLLATQNPPSFGGRSEEDPAIRQRCIKMKLDWPDHQAPSLDDIQRMYTDITTAGKVTEHNQNLNPGQQLLLADWKNFQRVVRPEQYKEITAFYRTHQTAIKELCDFVARVNKMFNL